MARKPKSSSKSKKIMREDKYERTTMTMATLNNLGDRVQLRLTGADFGGAESFIDDMSSPSYRWLLPGWLAEERVLANGRVYKYYYDPQGWQYNTKYDVLLHLSNLGIVVLDA